MQKAKLVDNATAGLKFQDSSTASALDGTILRAIFQNDNFDNLFTLVENAGYDLIDDDLEQITKAVRGEYNATFTYNTSTIATQSVNDIVLGSNGIYYEVQSDSVSGDDPVGSTTGDWLPYLPYKSGMKNLLINGRKLIQQRGTTGGKIQVVINTANLGGSHTLSWTGAATATIKEATTLGASDAATSWDAALATNVASGITVTLTANKYVHIEFSTTDFDLAQLEQGSVATNFEHRHNEADLCLKFYETSNNLVKFNTGALSGGASNTYETYRSLNTSMYTTPLIAIRDALNNVGKVTTLNVFGATFANNIAGTVSTISERVFTITVQVGTSASGFEYKFIANAEVFNADDGVGINYKEDRWYV